MKEFDSLHIVTEFIDGEQLWGLVPRPHGDCDNWPMATILEWSAQLFEGMTLQPNALRPTLDFKCLTRFLDLQRLSISCACTGCFLTGLAAMHTMLDKDTGERVRMLHRDFHGGNVLIAKDARGIFSTAPGAVKIIDVGMSKITKSLRPTSASKGGGHPSHMCRARREGKEFNDFDDVWAATCLITELETGKKIQRRSGIGKDGMDFAMPGFHEQRMAVVGECHGCVSTLVAKVLSCADFVTPQPEPDPLSALSLAECARSYLEGSHPEPEA